MFIVKLSIHGHVRELLNIEESVEIEIDQPVTILHLLSKRNIPSELIMTVFIDGKAVDKDEMITQPCHVLLMSPTAGG